MKLGIKKNINYNNYLGLPFEMQLPAESYEVRPESLDTFEPSYASSKVNNENDAIRNRISDFDIAWDHALFLLSLYVSRVWLPVNFDKGRISQPKNQ